MVGNELLALASKVSLFGGSDMDTPLQFSKLTAATLPAQNWNA